MIILNSISLLLVGSALFLTVGTLLARIGFVTFRVVDGGGGSLDQYRDGYDHFLAAMMAAVVISMAGATAVAIVGSFIATYQFVFGAF